jgi:hypothetical protein
MKTIQDQIHRSVMAKTIKSDVNARESYKILLRMKARNIRPDYKFIRNEAGVYDRVPDYEAWNFQVGSIHACMIRREDGEWTIHS